VGAVLGFGLAGGGSGISVAHHVTSCNDSVLRNSGVFAFFWRVELLNKESVGLMTRWPVVLVNFLQASVLSWGMDLRCLSM